MKKLRTHHFHITLSVAFILSGMFLGWFLLFGEKLAQTHFKNLSEALLAMFGLAAASFLVFCFAPYFRGDRRWYSVSTIFTLAFCIGSAMLWQMSGTVVAV